MEVVNRIRVSEPGQPYENQGLGLVLVVVEPRDIARALFYQLLHLKVPKATSPVGKSFKYRPAGPVLDLLSHYSLDERDSQDGDKESGSLGCLTWTAASQSLENHEMTDVPDLSSPGGVTVGVSHW